MRSRSTFLSSAATFSLISSGVHLGQSCCASCCISVRACSRSLRVITSLLTRAITSSTTTLLVCAAHESAGAIRRTPARIYAFFSILLLCSSGILAPRFQRKQYVSDGLCDALVTALQRDR